MKTDNLTWDDLRTRGVNFDYIITLNKNEDGTLMRVDYPITHLDSLFDVLKRMFEDDESYDTVDMEKAILREIELKPIEVCIPHEYNAVYINGSEEGGSNFITYECIDQQKVRKSLESRRSSLLSKYKQHLRWKNKELSAREIEREAVKLADKDYLSELHKEKISFLKKRMGFLHAYAYKELYDKISKNVFFVSSERIGWPSNKEKGKPTWIYEINEDIKVSLWSNFCYGNSSAFYIRVFYKGVQLCPYSEFVTYRKAREADILNYTRKYELRRDSWEAAADLVINFCNKAIEDPDSFIKEEITYEVKTLVRELSQIVNSKQLYLKSRFEYRTIDDTRYSHVANLITFDDYQLVEYNKNPDEYELLFRVEKISGALKFVNSLEKFSSIFKFIRRAIVKIEDLNVEIYPELQERLIPIRNEVAKLKEEVKLLEGQYEVLEKKVERHYRKIEIMQDRYKDDDDKEEAKKKYYKRHPELLELEQAMRELNLELSPLRRLLSLRNRFLDALEKCRLEIESYGVPYLELL